MAVRVRLFRLNLSFLNMFAVVSNLDSVTGCYVESFECWLCRLGYAGHCSIINNATDDMYSKFDSFLILACYERRHTHDEHRINKRRLTMMHHIAVMIRFEQRMTFRFIRDTSGMCIRMMPDNDVQC